MHGLAVGLLWAAILARQRNPAEVEHFASDLIELSTRQELPLLADFWINIPRLGASAVGRYS